MAPVKNPCPFEDLVELAKPITYDPQRSFKDQLRAIDVLRGQSQDSREGGDLENAYIYLGRAAAVINDHLPHHSQYNMLTVKQQTDLANVRTPAIFLTIAPPHYILCIIRTVVSWSVRSRSSNPN
jgi:hypothetical protein